MAETLLGATEDEIMESILIGKRKAIPAAFPKCLSKIVDQGWMPMSDDKKRPSLKEINTALKNVETTAPSSISREDSSTKDVSTEEQCNEINEKHIPLPIVSSIEWDKSLDFSTSSEMRDKMVENIRSSDLGSLINVSVLDVMKIVPRHLFVAGIRHESTEALIKYAYRYNYAMSTSATRKLSESAPEVIGSLLSLTDIEVGHDVLLVGIKGGYIQSVVVQLVGPFGSVLTVSSNSELIEVCRKRIDDHCPAIFRDRIRWLYVPHAEISDNVADALKRRKLSFHAIIYCGRVACFPESMKSVLRPVGQSSIVAPVDVKKEANAPQCMKIFKKNGASGEMRSITDFKFQFMDVI